MTQHTSSDAGVDSLVEEAVRTLRTFELTEYEAKCFVALTRLREGTAKEVSEVADVPRARIYDSMDALQDRGLVSVQESKPRRFRAVSPENRSNSWNRRPRPDSTDSGVFSHDSARRIAPRAPARSGRWRAKRPSRSASPLSSGTRTTRCCSPSPSRRFSATT
ncbi:TrmB family transcriptional regulator [Haloplanus litoreus]|uniref:TrmB family transcriptional regulator n=1 Tax=Haloplanus litoreus TaxID=767515 RepID=UPI00360FEEC6